MWVNEINVKDQLESQLKHYTLQLADTDKRLGELWGQIKETLGDEETIVKNIKATMEALEKLT